MKKVYDYIKKCGTYYIATYDSEYPRVTPFNTIDIFEGKLYMQTAKCKPVYHQMLKHPKIEICACKGMNWLRIQATAVFDERIEAEKHLLNACPYLMPDYMPGDGNNVVFYLKNVTATFSNFETEPEIVKF